GPADGARDRASVGDTAGRALRGRHDERLDVGTFAHGTRVIATLESAHGPFADQENQVAAKAFLATPLTPHRSLSFRSPTRCVNRSRREIYTHRHALLSPPLSVRLKATPDAPVSVCFRLTKSRFFHGHSDQFHGSRRREIRRWADTGSQGAGRGSQAPRHVHRFDLRARAAPSRVRGGRHLDRRGAGGISCIDQREASIYLED